MKKFPMRIVHVHDSCWNLDLWVICPAQHRELNKFVRRRFGIETPTNDGEFVGRFVELTGARGEEIGGVIALQNWKGRPKDYAILAHEGLHATHWFLKNRGMKLNFQNDEAFCYLMDSFICRIAEQLNKRR